MKKLSLLVTAAILPATLLCGCNKSPGNDARSLMPMINDIAEAPETDTGDEKTEPPRQRIEIEFGGKFDEWFGNDENIMPISGVRRRFRPNRSGTYTVEYIHTPYGVDKDETLDYKLTLTTDNTYTMTVVSGGVTAVHSGHWYERRGGSITIYYDEPMDDQQHNIYVSDSMYGELLPQDKIMIYDNNHTVVLAKQDDTAARQ